ncbi:MAG TPA: hypothetical protein VN285_00330 [Candidatus Deferrimicrobium sp.]|nr:hypothetical protein [Candidatus Deferrimicrobium sp.]
MTQTSGLLCWSCGRPTGIEGGVTRNDSCPRCLADLRCCRGCRFFDPYSRFQCRESIETNIPNKEKSNFCDFFQMRAAVKRPGGITAHVDSKDARRKKFDDLFKE